MNYSDLITVFFLSVNNETVGDCKSKIDYYSCPRINPTVKKVLRKEYYMKEKEVKQLKAKK